MIDLKYSLVVEATEDPTFFGFFSPDWDSARLQSGHPTNSHEITETVSMISWNAFRARYSNPIAYTRSDPRTVDILRRRGARRLRLFPGVPTIGWAQKLMRSPVANQRRRAPPRSRTRLPTDAGAGSVRGTAATTRDAGCSTHAAGRRLAQRAVEATRRRSRKTSRSESLAAVCWYATRPIQPLQASPVDLSDVSNQ